MEEEDKVYIGWRAYWKSRHCACARIPVVHILASWNTIFWPQEKPYFGLKKYHILASRNILWVKHIAKAGEPSCKRFRCVRATHLKLRNYSHICVCTCISFCICFGIWGCVCTYFYWTVGWLRSKTHSSQLNWIEFLSNFCLFFVFIYSICICIGCIRYRTMWKLQNGWGICICICTCVQTCIHIGKASEPVEE